MSCMSLLFNELTATARAGLNGYHSTIQRRALCATAVPLANRAIVYSRNGDPASVLLALSYPALPQPAPNTVNLKFLLSSVNPADLNVIEGVYPSKPTPRTNLAASGLGSVDQPAFIAGNEGLAEITAVGSGVTALQTGDWVIMTGTQVGTWASSTNVAANQVLKLPLPRGSGLTPVQGATISVNPPTAYNMLHDFIHLQKGDWIVQNGANSAVGQAVIQIASWRGFRTINFVRNRVDLEPLRLQLEELGADHVLTYEYFSSKSVRHKIKEWTQGQDIRLGLNCVGGKETAPMAWLLAPDAHLVTYGAMSKEPLSLPTSCLIFGNLTCHGFWQSRWYAERTQAEREDLIRILANLIIEGKLREPKHRIVTLGATDSDEEVGQKIRDIIAEIRRGRHGMKVLLRVEHR